MSETRARLSYMIEKRTQSGYGTRAKFHWINVESAASEEQALTRAQQLSAMYPTVPFRVTARPSE